MVKYGVGLLLVLGLVLLPVAGAEDNAPCPVITVESSVWTSTSHTDPLTFTAKVSDPNFSGTYNWAISTGSIISGQGTPVIEVAIPENPEDWAAMTATVELGGLASECPPCASDTIMKEDVLGY